MKVTVSFADTKVVVPCGDGGIPVRALAEMAICRFRKSIGANFNVTRRLSLSQDAEALLSVSTITTAITTSTESEGILEESPNVVHAIGEAEGRFARQRQPSTTIFIVEALTLARDGGILDWDDRVCDVLDDREMLLAKFKWDFPDTRSLNSSSSTLPRTGKSIAPLVVPCNGELEDMQEFSFSAPTAPNSTVTSLMDSWTPSSSVVSLNPPVRTNAPLPPTYIQRTPSPLSLDFNIDKPEQSIVLEPLEMGNQPPAVPPHQNLILANPDEFRSTISQESNPTVMTPVLSSPMTISKSLLPTSNVMRRPAPRPPVNTAQRSSPSPPVTMAANNPISQNFTAIANGIIADPLKDDSIQPQSLSTFSRNLSSQLSTESPILNFNPEPPLPRLPIQLLPSLEEESSHSSTLSKIPEEDDNTSQASTVVVVVQSHHQPQQQQHRSSNSPSASVSTTSSSTTLPLSSSPQRTRSSVHTTPAESSDTEEEEPLEKSTRRPKKTSKRDGKFLTKHRKAFRWGSRQRTDKGEVSTPSSEDDVDNTDRSKQSSSTPVPQKDPLAQTRANPRGASPSVWQLRDSSSNETPSAFTDLRKPPPPPPPLATPAAATASNNAGTPTTIISTNTPSTSINPTAPLKINTPLASLVGHPAPPPPPKRSPQTVLTGKPEESAITTQLPKSTAPQPPPSQPPPPPPTKEASSMVVLSPRPITGHPRVDDSSSGMLDEASVLHMTDLLTRKHASDSVREYILSAASSEMEHERERRLQAAAVNVVAFRRRVPAVQGHPLFEATRSTVVAAPPSASTSATLERPASAVVSKVLPAEEEITIRLIKAAAGLGFSLTTKEVFLGAYSAAPTSPAKSQQSSLKSQQQTVHLTSIFGRAVCVKSIIPGGVALKDGSLRVGDRLLKVDREDVSNKSQAQIVSLLRVKPVGSEVELVVRRPQRLTAAGSQTSRNVENENAYRTMSPGTSLVTCGCMSPHCGDYSLLRSGRIASADDSQIGNQTERFEKCVYLKLDIPLLPVEAQLSVESDGGGSGVAMTIRNRLAAMRLGVSVREDIPEWYPNSATTSGIFVKGLIEGGAAHADGRLRIGDEILEVNGISLVNTPNPLALLRAVLKQISSLTPLNVPPNSPSNCLGDQTTAFPIVRLLIARRIRHRRSASGHTISSNAGLEVSPTTTVEAGPLIDISKTPTTVLLNPVNNNPFEIPSRPIRISADVHATSSMATTVTTTTTENVARAIPGVGLEESTSSPSTLRKKRVAPNPVQQNAISPQTKKIPSEKW